MRVIKTSAILFWILFCGFTSVESQPDIRELTSNNITSLAGHGDTLWMTTEKGINLLYAPQNTVSWRGYFSPWPWAIGFGNGVMLGALQAEAFTSPNNLLAFSPATNNFSLRETFIRSPSPDTSFQRGSVDIAWSPGLFWIASLDGGLVRWSITDGGKTVLLPGDTTSFQLTGFPDRSNPILAGFPDTTKRIWSVASENHAPGSTRIWAMSERKVYVYSPSTPAWDTLTTTLGFSGYRLSSFVDLYVDTCGDSAVVFACMAFVDTQSSSPDTMLCKYGFSSRQWFPFVKKRPVSVKFGSGRTLYAIHDNQVNRYSDTLADVLLPHRTPVVEGRLFQSRMQLSSTQFYYSNITLNDLLYTRSSNGLYDYLWIATSGGLFFSSNETADEISNTPFRLLRDSVSVRSGLLNAFALPGIIVEQSDISANRFGGKTTFMYNLTKSAKVTITIFDWNMDVVKVVANQVARTAGASRPVWEQDTWDATNKWGKKVSPGLYYYRIQTDQKERAFGKIIVAQ